jgi:hypothetical protein
MSMAAARNINALTGILFVAVDYGIRYRLVQCDFYVGFTSICISEDRNEPHELIYSWRDGRDFSRERLAQID